jgi:hypothetical protein
MFRIVNDSRECIEKDGLGFGKVDAVLFLIGTAYPQPGDELSSLRPRCGLGPQQSQQRIRDAAGSALMPTQAGAPTP